MIHGAGLKADPASEKCCEPCGQAAAEEKGVRASTGEELTTPRA